MADTIRERIITAFVTRAAALSTLTVGRAVRSIDDATSARFVSIWDGEDTLRDQKYGHDLLQFPIAIEVIWMPGATNPSVSANALMGEIVDVMIGIGDDRTFGGLVDRISIPTKSPQYPQDGSDYTTLTVIFLIDYKTLTGNPYSAG